MQQKNEEFRKSTIEKYLNKKSDESEELIMTKDRAYIASRKLVEHFLHLKGRENSNYIDKNFDQVWRDND